MYRTYTITNIYNYNVLCVFILQSQLKRVDGRLHNYICLESSQNTVFNQVFPLLQKYTELLNTIIY